MFGNADGAYGANVNQLLENGAWNEEDDLAEAYVRQLNAAHVFRKPIATRIDALKGFFKAEDYHQDYLVRHPDAPYIATYDLPKVTALKALFPANYRPTPVTVL